MKKILTLLLLLCSTTLLSQTIYYVKPTGNDANTGTSWTTAFRTVQKALDTITTGQVWVAAGTYYPDEGGGATDNDRNASFWLKMNVALYGGFTGDETALTQRNWRHNATILSGEIQGDGDSTNNAHHVVWSTNANNTAVLDGFIITNGCTYGNGAGMRNDYSSPTISNCTFTKNTAGQYGGGMYNFHSSPLISNCTFSQNISRNLDGGGIANWYSSPVLTNCLFYGNIANAGGGLSNYESDPKLTNCTFSGNTSLDSWGGSIYNSWSNPILTNCILWDGRPLVDENRSHSWISYSLVQGGFSTPGYSTPPGLIVTDPLFVDASAGNLHLTPESPAIDAGNNAAATNIPYDLDGHLRIVHQRVDMGAYEFQNVVFVDNDAAGNNNGTSWTDAFTSLQDALTRASTSTRLNQIWVARGLYYPDEGTSQTDNDRSASFHLRNNVAIYGGFAGNEALLTQRNPSLNATVLSGDIDRDNTLTGNAYHVVTAASVDHTAILDGFTIAGGMADGPADQDKQGGGVYMSAASARLYYCSFGWNEATYGGGVYATGSLASFSWCDFQGNKATRGGALYNAALSQLTVMSSSFSDNEAADGGGIYNEPRTVLHITNGRFFQNRATGPAEGPYKGGAICNASAYNYMFHCSFTANTASPGYGGALYNENSSPNITNTILWGNSSEIDNDAGSTPAVSFSLVQDGYAAGTNILNEDPQFINGPLGDLHLRGCSPAIDAGTQEGAYFADLEGNHRPMFDGVDIGAYEYQPGGPGGIVYVKGDATGRNDGTSWADAFTRLQDALARAGSCKALEIWVATGTYYPTDISTDRTASFVLQNNVTILGGFTGTELPGGPQTRRTGKSTMSGDIDHDGSLAGNAYHVVRSTGNDLTAVLDGFIITGGHADGTTAPDNMGAGIYLSNSSPTLTRCTVTGNTAANDGAGIYNDHSAPTISRCIISHNQAPMHGGGIYNYYSSPAITNTVFWKDTATYGGGLYNFYSSSPRVTNCTFVANGYSQYGGGIYNSNQAAPLITNTILWANSSAIYNAPLGAPVVSYSIVQGGYAAGANILDTDPLFVNADSGKLYVQKESPAIGAGTPNGAPDIDLEGAHRSRFSVTIGAYEYLTSTGGPPPGPFTPLTITCPEDFTLNTGEGSCGTAIDFTDAHAATASGGKAPVTLAYTPASGTELTAGENTITVTATDAAGVTKTCTFTVTVTDATPPVITPPFPGVDAFGAHTDPDACWYTTPAGRLDITATDNCTGPLTYFYSLSGATTTEGAVEGSTLSGVKFNKGETLVHYGVRDGAGNEATYTLKVIVSDYTSPRLTGVSVDQPVLYPPNHQLQVVTVNYTATDNCPGVTTSLSVSSNEAVNAAGDGNTGPDWEIINNHQVKLRAERSGKGTGRVYTITLTAQDAAGNTATATTTVTVPHDKGAPVTSAQAAEQQPEVGSLTVQAVPNPSSDGFTLHTQSPYTQPLTIKVMDGAGRVIEQRTGVVPSGVQYLGSTYRPGVYYLQVGQGEVMQTLKLIKQGR